MSIIYSDGRLVGKNNPNYGNGIAIKNAYSRGCYDHRSLPKHTQAKGSYYKEKWMRSTWEIEFAKLLDSLNFLWKHESKRFRLSDGRNYTPDFFIPELNIWIEIKGHWYEKAKIKFEQFRTEYPEIKIVVIDQEIWKSPVTDLETFLLTNADLQMSTGKISLMN